MLHLVIAATLASVPCERHVDFSGWKGGAVVRFEVIVTTRNGKVEKTEIELLDGSNAGTACVMVRLVLDDCKVPYRAAGPEGLVIEQTPKSGIRSVIFVPKGWAPLVTTVPVVPKKK